MNYETELQNIIDMWDITESTDVRKDQAVLLAVWKFVIKEHWDTLRDNLYDDDSYLRGLIEFSLESKNSKDITYATFGQVYHNRITGHISDIFHGAVGNSEVNYADEKPDPMFNNPTYDLVAADRRSGK